MIKKLLCLVSVLMATTVYSGDINKEYIEANKGLKAIFAELDAKHPIIAGNFAHYEPALPTPKELPYSGGPKQEIIEVLLLDDGELEDTPVVVSKEDREKIDIMTARIEAMFGLGKDDMPASTKDESKTNSKKADAVPQ